ncbi:MAG: transposase [Candidatus Azobacteroides sp.]|nr:transposase [Candidatus Azobacteroides sp.]
MPTGYQITEQDGVYFLTLQIVEWVDIFTRKTYRDILIESLRFCQQNKQLEIYAFVIMSNHMHLIARSGTGKLSDTIREVKSFTAKQIIRSISEQKESRKEWILNLFAFAAKKHKRNTSYQVWTHENHAEIIYTNHFFEQKLEYIHQNPVKAGWVEFAEDYLYSSAGCDAGREGLLEIIKEIRPIEKNRRTRYLP